MAHNARLAATSRPERSRLMNHDVDCERRDFSGDRNCDSGARDPDHDRGAIQIVRRLGA